MLTSLSLPKASLFAFAVALAGCAGPPRLPADLSSLADENTRETAEIVLAYRLYKNDSYGLLDSGPCEKNWTGLYARRVYTSRFRENADGSHSLKVKTDRPITVSYLYSISDKYCKVAGTFMPQPGQTYKLAGTPLFASGLISVSTGCKIEVTDNKNDVVPLMRPLATEGLCTPQTQ